MEGFFQAGAVAVIGVSNSPGNLGRNIALNLMEFRYEGRVYLVGSKGGSFLGHKIYPSATDIPDPVDLACILVPARAVPGVLSQCGRKGVKRVVVETAGFGELGDDRKTLEQELLAILKEHGMRMIGPNCLGIMNAGTGLALPFLLFPPREVPGSVGIISQSGGVGAMMVNFVEGENIGFSKFASIGNKLNVNEADLLEYYLRDPETDAVYCYLEGIDNGRRLMEVAFRSAKPVVIQKSNNSRSGSLIARSHSASLSSDDRVLDAAFRQCGMMRTREQREGLEYLKAFRLPPMKGNRLAVISRSGGHAVMAADAAEECFFDLPPFPEEIISLVHAHSRANVIQFHNPMDLGDLFDFDLYLRLADETLARDDIDGLVFIHNYQGSADPSDSRRLAVELGALIAKRGKPAAICVFASASEIFHMKQSVSFPIFSDPREAVRALALVREREERRPIEFSRERPRDADFPLARSLFEALPPGPVPPERLAGMLSAYGISLIPWEKAETEQEAVDAANRLGFPVALKTADARVLHKTEEGAVRLNLSDEASLRSAYRDLLRIGPSALVQKMSPSGMEWLVGGGQDDKFGPTLLAGLGGVYVEIFKETALRIAPIVTGEAERMLNELKGSAILAGVRGGEPLDRGALVDLMARVSWLLADFAEIRELDLNPVCVLKEGCFALDWRAVKGPADIQAVGRAS